MTAECETGPSLCPECGAQPATEGPRCERCGGELSASARHRQLIGRLIGPFLLESVRRRTPAGTAFAAIDQTDGLWVELEVSALHGGAHPKRAQRERQLRLQLAHPHLVRVLSAGEAGEFAYVATDARPEEGPLADARLHGTRLGLRIASEVCAGLAFLHQHRLVHGCLDPSQVLYDPTSATARLAGPGACLSADGQESAPKSTGNPAYAAPETARGRFSVASDLYSLGALLAYCLCGRAPFGPDREGRRAFVLEHLEEEATLLPELRELLQTLTAPDPGARPKRAQLVRRRLQTLLGERAEVSPVPLDAPSPGRSVMCEDLEELGATGFRLTPALLAPLPLPLAQAALSTWNARPGLPRRMIAYVLWETVTRLLAALGCALLSDRGQPLPTALARRPFRPSFGQWIVIAREALGACPADDELARCARACLFDTAPGRRHSLLRFLEELVELRNKSAHLWPEDEEIDLLSRLLELAKESAFLREGRLLTIESAVLDSDSRVRYQPLALHGAQGPVRGRPFSAAPGLACERVYWQFGQRFLELDPFWIFEGGEVLQLQRVDKGRVRYIALDDRPPRVLRERFAEWTRLLGGAEPALEAPGLATPASEPPPSRDPYVGRMLGSVYRVVAEVGQGGMGRVYRGWDTRLQREVALKLLLGGAWADREVRRRFLNEARVLASVGHPHLVRIFDAGEEGGCLYSVMELLPGPTLAERLEHACDRAAVREVVGWVRDAARALDACHRAGVVHRDIKPANLMLDGRGEVRVLDFGLAHIGGEDLTRTRAHLGTPRYMAPEQILDAKRVGPASDIYGLGMSLYALLSGAEPFADKGSEHAILKAAQVGAFPRLRKVAPDLPEELETIVAKATRPREERRYASAAALAEDLERWLGHRPILARPAGGVERLAKYCRRHPVRAVALSLLGTLLLAMTVMTSIVLDQAATVRRNLDDVERLYDRARAEQLAREVHHPPDSLVIADWIARYRDLAGRLPVHRETLESLTARAALGVLDSVDASLHEVLDSLCTTWDAHVMQMRPHKENALAALRAQYACAAALGETVAMTNSLAMQMTLIPPGSFRMGASTADFAHLQPPHTVHLRHPFRISRMEVHHASYVVVMREARYGYIPKRVGLTDAPVSNVTWYEAVLFCNLLSRREGREELYTITNIVYDGRGRIDTADVALRDPHGDGYRLPSDAEWEYACRAFSTGTSYGPLGATAWTTRDALGSPRPGGLRDPNVWGLYDTLGNVGEWCGVGSYPIVADEVRVDPQDLRPVGKRISKGGSYIDDRLIVRAGFRDEYDAIYHSLEVGFRVVLGAP